MDQNLANNSAYSPDIVASIFWGHCNPAPDVCINTTHVIHYGVQISFRCPICRNDCVVFCFGVVNLSICG